MHFIRSENVLTFLKRKDAENEIFVVASIFYNVHSNVNKKIHIIFLCKLMDYIISYQSCHVICNH